jgi:hypothetical protein
MALNRRRVGLKGEAPPKKKTTKKAKAPAAYVIPNQAISRAHGASTPHTHVGNALYREAEIRLPDVDGEPDFDAPAVPDLGDDEDEDEGSSDSEWEV